MCTAHVLALFLAVTVVLQTPDHIGESVELHLTPPNRAASAPRNVPLSLTVKRVHLTRGAELAATLEALGISPSADAYRLTYELNPDIADLGTLVDRDLEIPTLTRNALLDSLLRSGWRVRIDVDQGLRDSLVRAIARVRILVEVDKAKAPTDLISVRAAEVASNALDTLALLGGIVSKTNQPVGHSLLEQLATDAATAETILTLASKRGSASEPDLDRLSAIADDLDIKLSGFSETRGPGQPPKKWAEVTISVDTIRFTDGSVVPRLQVFYVPVALADIPGAVHSFAIPSSPAVDHLPEANYYIWAAADGQSPALTERHYMRARDGGQQQFTLIVQK